MIPHVFDAIVVGAGFSGLSCLYELRKYGFSTKVFEAGSGIGGVWHWNSYPGARVDIDFFAYQFPQAEFGKDFVWQERFPNQVEIHRYFSHVEKRLNFSRDIQFNTRVTSSKFDSNKKQWEVTTSDGRKTRCRYFIVCTGAESKTHWPKISGLESFRGQCYHTGEWALVPEIDFKNKRVGVIGTGASGIQVIQEIGPLVDHLTVFQRTPITALPIGQKRRGVNWDYPEPLDFGQIHKNNLNSTAGTGMKFVPLNCVDATEKEREAFYEELYAQGGFAFRLATYQDTFTSLEANEHAYNFWRKKTVERIQDPVKQELLAPALQLHPFGAKRACLEQTYYEVFNQSNVDLVNLRTNSIVGVTASGIQLGSGKEIDLDIIVLATGFDNVTGALLDIIIENASGQNLRDHWKDGIRTSFGIAANGFPNLFFLYGPQSPSDLANGPTVAKLQSDWLLELIVWMRANGKESVEANLSETEKWAAHVQEAWDKSLLSQGVSWQQGCNIPGKKKEPLCYSGGIPAYSNALADVSENNYEAFNFL